MNRKFTTIIISLLLSGCSQLNIGMDSNSGKTIPVDPEIVIGKLENGLTYYIKQNGKPENRAEMLLVVNTGSIMEDDHQQGLAHFAEHMAFNGTKRFPKQELVNYLESIGMQFGPDLNAYTSFDETVYMLQIPTDDEGKLIKGFEILEDWAHQLQFEDEEIDKERGVVIEEWRMRSGAHQRLLDQKLPVFLKGSKYADRMPIGKKDILETFEYDALKSFYWDWYRPDLMAVIAVGDFEIDYIQSLIKSHFSNVKPENNPRQRKNYDVPDHNETYFIVATDPEATMSAVGIQVKLGKKIQSGTQSEYRENLIQELFTNMMDARLQETLKIPDTPLIYGYSYFGSIVRFQSGFNMGAGVKPGMILTGLELLLTELERVKQFGFTRTELERQKSAKLSNLEKLYNERDKMESRRLKWEFAGNFLENEPIPGIKWEYLTTKSMLPEINLIDINNLSNTLKGDGNRVVYADSPETEGIVIPDELDLQSIFDKVKTLDISPYEDKFVDEPLVENIPTQKSIIEWKTHPDTDINEIVLENGVRVLYKSTDFKNDELLMKAYSPGGTSVIEDRDYVSAMLAANFQEESGIGAFSKTALEKYLAGKIVDVTPYINELREGFNGSCSPADLEPMLQIIYQYFHAQREDHDAFEAFYQRYSGFIANRNARPETVYRDSINVIMNSHHFRSRPMTIELMSEIHREKVYEVFKDRFADADDFTFVFTGAIDEQSFLPLIQTYLGNLPVSIRKESWKDVGRVFPVGRIEKEVHKGLDPKSSVQIRYSGEFEWSRENRFQIRSLAQAFRIKLREVLREDMSGTYGVWAWASPEHYPNEKYQFGIAFGCAPGNVKSLVKAVNIQIDSLKLVGLDESYLDKVRESIRMERQKDLKENKFWLNSITAIDQYEEDFSNILNIEDLLPTLTKATLIKTAHKYLNEDNVLQVVLYPENWTD